MNIIGIIKNYLSIIVNGDYIAGDGPSIHEDSAIYDLAYLVCNSIGTCF